MSAAAGDARQGRRESKQEEYERKATEFVVGKLAARGNSSGVPISFDGTIPLSAELASLARDAFPKHRFTVARLKVVMDVNIYDSHVLVVSDAESGEVVSHVHDPVFGGGAPESFRKLLAAYNPSSRDDAVRKLGLLARLVGYPDRPVGEARLHNGSVEAAVYWDDKPWRVLRAKLGPDKRLGRLLFINPVRGKDWDTQAKEIKESSQGATQSAAPQSPAAKSPITNPP